ncbi:DNA-binding barrel domain superfamily [Sesbania bispinosa]|nr:DNA-binding barrel domain superfamily [Sesbania bispinosa]
MWEPDFDYIMQRWEHFRAKLNSTQRSVFINCEFYLHWIEYILNQEVYLRDPVGNMHTVWVRNTEKVGFFREGVREMIQFYGLEGKHFIDFRYNGDGRFDIQIFDVDLMEIEYPPLPNVPPPPNHVVVNDGPPEIQNGQPADIVGWDIVASEPFASGEKPLYIPAHVVEIMLLRRQQLLDLIDDAGNRIEATFLKRKKEPYVRDILDWDGTNFAGVCIFKLARLCSFVSVEMLMSLGCQLSD